MVTIKFSFPWVRFPTCELFLADFPHYDARTVNVPPCDPVTRDGLTVAMAMTTMATTMTTNYDYNDDGCGP